MTKFCPSCGSSTVPGAQFCGNCGAAIPADVDAPLKASQTVPGMHPEAMSLFDINRQYYLIQRQWWGWGSGLIKDEGGTVIGHLHRRFLTIRDTTEFREADDQIISATINRKIIAIRDTIDIKDAHDQLLGRVKQKILTLFRPVVWIEDPRGKKILEAKGNFLGFSFVVRDRKKNVVAEIDKADKWKDIFLGGSAFDFSNLYAVVIHDPDIDRRLVMPLAIAIDEVVHEDRKGRR